MYVFVQTHLGCMNLENLVFCLEIWHWKLNFSIDSAWSDKSWIQTLNFVGCHDDLDFCLTVESVKLIEQLQHSSLYFFFSSRVRIISLGSYCIYLVDENNRRSVLLSSLEEFSDQFRSISQILLDELRTDYSKESC